MHSVLTDALVSELGPRSLEVVGSDGSVRVSGTIVISEAHHTEACARARTCEA